MPSDSYPRPASLRASPAQRRQLCSGELSIAPPIDRSADGGLAIPWGAYRMCAIPILRTVKAAVLVLIVNVKARRSSVAGTPRGACESRDPSAIELRGEGD